MLCLLFLPDRILSTLLESSSWLIMLDFGLADFNFLAADEDTALEGVAGEWLTDGGFWLAGEDGTSEFSWWRAKDFVISPAEEKRSPLRSLSAELWVSNGPEAINRSNQLQPHWGLVGSMNSKLVDFVDFFHVCCSVEILVILNLVTKYQICNLNGFHAFTSRFLGILVNLSRSGDRRHSTRVK